MVLQGLRKLLEKFGRAEVLVDFFGDIHWRRWHLFYYETLADTFKNKLPNVFLHNFPTHSPDGEDSHQHPYSTIGFIIKGGYTELINDERVRVAKRWSFNYLSYKDRHRLLETQPDTWTLFFHGFKRQPWKFHSKKHTVICDYCNENNGGVCHKDEKVMDFGEFLNRGEAKQDTAFTKRRTIGWLRVTPELTKKIQRRVEALKRSGVAVPDTKDQKYAAMKEIIVKRKPNA